MARQDPFYSRAGGSGYKVEAPRESDAIGRALRNAYERDVRNGVPDDMAGLLARLNQLDAPSN